MTIAFTLAAANVQVVSQGITLAGSLELGARSVRRISLPAPTANGNFALKATVSTNFGSYAPATTASLMLSNAGMAANARVEFLGQHFAMEGSIQPNLDFQLTGKGTVRFRIPLVNPTANVAVTLQNSGGTVVVDGSFRPDIQRTRPSLPLRSHSQRHVQRERGALPGEHHDLRRHRNRHGHRPGRIPQCDRDHCEQRPEDQAAGSHGRLDPVAVLTRSPITAHPDDRVIFLFRKTLLDILPCLRSQAYRRCPS